MKNIAIFLIIFAMSVFGQEGEYDHSKRFKKGLKYAVKGQCMGLINSSGKIILPIEYDDIDPCKRDFVYIFKDGGRGVFSLKSSKVIVPPQYGDIDLIKKGESSFFIAYGKDYIVEEYNENGKVIRQGLSICGRLKE